MITVCLSYTKEGIWNVIRTLLTYQIIPGVFFWSCRFGLTSLANHTFPLVEKRVMGNVSLCPSQCHITVTLFSDRLICPQPGPVYLQCWLLHQVNPEPWPSPRTSLPCQGQGDGFARKYQISENVIMISKSSENIPVQWMPLKVLNLGTSNLFLLNMEIHAFCESFIELRVEPHSNEFAAKLSQIPFYFDFLKASHGQFFVGERLLMSRNYRQQELRGPGQKEQHMKNYRDMFWGESVVLGEWSEGCVSEAKR